VKKIVLPIAAAVVSIAAGGPAFAAGLPTYAVSGFPISPVQVQLLGAANVEQQLAAPTVVASPHQVSVLTPRKLETATAAPISTGTGH